MTEYYKHIEKLIGRFEEGLTDNGEEKELYDFFGGGNVPGYLKEYIPVFGYFESGLANELKTTVPKSKKRLKLKITISAAAVIILLIAFLTLKNDAFNRHEGSYMVKNGEKIYDPRILEAELKEINAKMNEKESEIENLYKKTEKSILYN